MSYTIKQIRSYNQDRERTCQALGITKNQYNWLRRKGQELRKLYEDECNGIADYKIQEIKENDLENKVIDYVKELNLFVYFQTDPRGGTLYLDKQPIPENNYTNAYLIY